MEYPLCARHRGGSVSLSEPGAFSHCSLMYPKHLARCLAHGGAESIWAEYTNECTAYLGFRSVTAQSSHVCSVVGLGCGVRLDFRAEALTHPPARIKKEFLPWRTGWISASLRSLPSESDRLWENTERGTQKPRQGQHCELQVRPQPSPPARIRGALLKGQVRRGFDAASSKGGPFGLGVTSWSSSVTAGVGGAGSGRDWHMAMPSQVGIVGPEPRAVPAQVPSQGGGWTGLAESRFTEPCSCQSRMPSDT